MTLLVALAAVLGSTEMGVRGFAQSPADFRLPLAAQVPIGDPDEDGDGMEDDEDEDDGDEEGDDEAPWS